MKSKININEFQNNTSKLLFALSCAERVANLYKAFDEQQKTSNYTIISGAIDFMYNSIINNKLIDNCKVLNDMYKKCVAFAPDSDGYGEIEANIAQYVAIITAYTIKFSINNDDNCITYCSNYVIEIVENLYFEKNGYTNDTRIIDDKEYEIQNQIISILKNTDYPVQKKCIDKIRNYNMNNCIYW